MSYFRLPCYLVDFNEDSMGLSNELPYRLHYGYSISLRVTAFVLDSAPAFLVDGVACH